MDGGQGLARGKGVDAIINDLDRTAFAALRQGHDARELFAAAIAANPYDFALRIGDAEARFAAGESEPWRGLDVLLAARPDWVAGHSLRAALRWESGLGAAFADGLRDAVGRQPGHAGLWNAYIAALSGIGDHNAAADAARLARERFDTPVLGLIEASHAGTAGDITRAARLLAALPADLPGRIMIDVRQALRLGDPVAADLLLAKARNDDPADLGVWALTELVWRLLGNDRAAWLAGQDGLIDSIELDFSTPTLACLPDVLREMHRHRSQPLGQSVRRGTQTRGRLFDRHEEPIQELRRTIQRAIDAYVARLPARDRDHPLLRHRERRLVAQGGWSVRLQHAGHHVPHLHPAGIVSSACYIAVPPLDATEQEGWLELGAPPPDLRVNIAPRVSIEPLPGRLILFPSYLYHGTRPFRTGERLSVAFDAVADDRPAV